MRPCSHRFTTSATCCENSVWAKVEPRLRLRQFKVARAVLVQQNAEREAIHHGFAVLHRYQRTDANLQTHPQGSSRPRQFQLVGTVLRQQRTESKPERSANFGDSPQRTAPADRWPSRTLRWL